MENLCQELGITSEQAEELEDLLLAQDEDINVNELLADELEASELYLTSRYTAGGLL